MFYRKKRDIFLKKRSFVLFLTSLILFLTTSHFLVDLSYEIQDTPDAVAQVFKHKYIVSNTYDGKLLCFTSLMAGYILLMGT